MRTIGIVPILLAASFVASTSCRDTTAPAVAVGGLAAPATPLISLEGVVHLSSNKLNGIVLSVSDGPDVVLDGPEAAELASVENADVQVRGRWDADTFLVADFLVRQVDGADVMDGILINLSAMEIASDTIGYALRLTQGSIVPLRDPPAELTAHVGERVWVAESADGQATAFGIIGR
jgi:hypothetical protein